MWMEQLFDHAALSLSERKRGNLQVHVDGFYGQESGLEQYKDGAILVGGGSVTPMFSIVKGLLQETTIQNIDLFWVASTIE